MDKKKIYEKNNFIIRYITKELGSFNEYQIRIQGFLSERIATIFYHKYFGDSRIKVYNFVYGDEISPKNSSGFTNIIKKESKITTKNKIIILIILLIIQSIIVIFIIKCFGKIKKQKHKKYFKIKRMKRRKNRKKKKMLLIPKTQF